jgi:hypothetical protein
MQKRSSIPKTGDLNQHAASIVAQSMDGPAELADPPRSTSAKNPAAVALGRLGGLKGGKARAESLSAKKRKEIAQKAARKRWNRETK